MNNMNFMGMNFMGMNPMGMNQIGMNNQQNFMNDETARNIKNIIEPYENKIRELEEIIKQKDFEIIVLKQKLNNNNMPNNNFMNINPMMMNMNMNPMNMNINNLNNRGKEIRLMLKFENGENSGNYINFFEGDKASLIRQKFNVDSGILTNKYKLVNEDLTIKENDIESLSIIKVTNQIFNVLFFTTTGMKSQFLLDPDCSIGRAIIIYCVKNKKVYDLIDKRIHFLYNTNKFEFNDKTKLKYIFKGNVNPKIQVCDTYNLINGF